MTDTSTPTYSTRPIGYRSKLGVSTRFSPIDHEHNVLVEDWKALDLLNGWIYYGADNWVPPEYLLLPTRFVVIHATIKDGTTTNDTPIGLLPMGYRPKYVSPMVGYNSTGELVCLTAETNGEVWGKFGLDSSLTTFSGTFEADRDVFVQTRS